MKKPVEAASRETYDQAATIKEILTGLKNLRKNIRIERMQREGSERR